MKPTVFAALVLLTTSASAQSVSSVEQRWTELRGRQVAAEFNLSRLSAWATTVGRQDVLSDLQIVSQHLAQSSADLQSALEDLQIAYQMIARIATTTPDQHPSLIRIHDQALAAAWLHLTHAEHGNPNVQINGQIAFGIGFCEVLLEDFETVLRGG